MTVKEVFELRKQGEIEEAYAAIRPMYREHKGRYTTLCMFWVASDIFKKRMDEGRTDEARKILEALKRMQPRVEAITKELDAQSASKRPEKITSNSHLSPLTSPVLPKAMALSTDEINQISENLSPVPANLPWEKTDQSTTTAASAFISSASHRLAKATATVPDGSPEAPVPDGSPSGGKECPAVSPQSECPAVLPHGNSVPYAATPLQPNLQRLLEVVKGEMSVKEMMAALGFASRDKFLKNYLSPALKAGLVEMTDPNSPKSPKQRYRKAKGDM